MYNLVELILYLLDTKYNAFAGGANLSVVFATYVAGRYANICCHDSLMQLYTKGKQ